LALLRSSYSFRFAFTNSEKLSASPGEPEVAISLWLSSCTILSTCVRCTTMLWLRLVSLTSSTKPSPTRPKSTSVMALGCRDGACERRIRAGACARREEASEKAAWL
jgi:hypothetical protein